MQTPRGDSSTYATKKIEGSGTIHRSFHKWIGNNFGADKVVGTFNFNNPGGQLQACTT